MAKFRFEKDLFGHRGAPIIQEFPVAAAQTLVAGDLVYLSSGQVTIAGNSQTSVLGIMAEDVTEPDADTLVAVQVAAPGYVYRATADGDASSHVLAAKKYDINATTQTVDVGDAADGCIIILELADSTTDIRIMFTEFDLAGVN
jgi:hypothetical protein